MTFSSWTSLELHEFSPGVRQRRLQGRYLLQAWSEMDPGAEAPMHSHPTEQVSQVLAGRVEVTVADRSAVLGPGEFVHVPPGVPHAFRNIGQDVAVILGSQAGPM